MRIHRFFIEQKLEIRPKIFIEDEALIHQWRSVLRFQVGQQVILYDNTGNEYQATIILLSKDKTEIEVHGSRRSAFAPRFPLFLFASLAKRDSFEWMIEKGTELGVMGFCPVVSEHSEKKEINMERSKILIKEACEQSWRPIKPEIFEPVSLAEALENLANAGGVTFALDPTGELMDTEKYAAYRAAGEKGERINVFIGPEGGFSPREVELLKERGVELVSLGKQILRAETAAVAISSVLLLG